MKRIKYSHLFCVFTLAISLLLVVGAYPSILYAETNWSTYFTGYDFESMDNGSAEYVDFSKTWDATWPVTGSPELFTTPPKDSYSFKCIRISPDGALIYSAKGGAKNFTVLEIPEKVYDPYIEQNLTVVGVIAEAEIQNFEENRNKKRNSDEFEEMPFSYYPKDASISDDDLYYADIDNTWIGEIVLPKTLKVVGRGAFYGYRSLNKITINSDATIGPQAFCNCPALTDIVFNNSAVTVCARAFMDCKSLKNVTFPANGKIAQCALQGCMNLETVTNAPEFLYIGSAYEEEGIAAPKLKKIVYNNNLKNVYGFFADNDSYAMDEKYGESEGWMHRNDTLQEVVLPAGVECVGGFEGCTALKKINLPDTIKEIEESAFAGDSQLTGPTRLPSSIQNVGDQAFYRCRNLRMAVVHPGNVLEYQYKDSGITSIKLRKDMIELFPGGFTGCPNLTSIEIEGGSIGHSFMTKDGVLYLGINYDSSKDEWTEWALGKYPAGKSGGSYTLPSFVTGICAFAFEGCKFSEIHIPVQVSEFYEDWMASLTEDKVYHPFENMAVQSTMYVVKNSYADWEYGGGAYSPLKYENGPAVKIRYVLNGGKNNSANPATIPGGTTLKLSNPTRTGYKFVGWKVAGGSDDHKITEITPDSDELCKGVVSYAVEAIWKETVPAAGSTYKLSAGTFKIVTKVKDSKAGSVAFTKAKNKSSVTVPATVKIKGKTYKVTQIRAKAFTGKRIRKVTIGKNVKIIKKYAFKGSKATKLIFKTKLLKKSKVKGCLKGSKVKTIQIKLGKKSLNKKYVKLYKKYFTKANAGRKVTIKM